MSAPTAVKTFNWTCNDLNPLYFVKAQCNLCIYWALPSSKIAQVYIFCLISRQAFDFFLSSYEQRLYQHYHEYIVAILDGKAESTAGYFEGFDYDKNEIVTLKEVRLNMFKVLGPGNRRGIYSNPYNCINCPA